MLIVTTGTLIILSQVNTESFVGKGVFLRKTEVYCQITLSVQTILLDLSLLVCTMSVMICNKASKNSLVA